MSRELPLYKQVRDSIASRIYSKELEAGQKLPSIPEFAREYGVSTITIRGAFKQLREEGLIYVRHGRNARVAFDNKTAETRDDYINWVLARKEAITDLYWLDARLLAEGCRFCAPLLTDRDIRALENIRDDIEAAPTAKDVLDCENKFVLTIFEKAESPFLSDLFMAMCDFVCVPIVLAAEMKQPKMTSPKKTALNYAQTILGMIAAKDYDGIYDFTFTDFSKSCENCVAFMNKLAKKKNAPEEQVRFHWLLLRDNALRYNKIINDLTIRIAIADYKADDFLPCEADLRDRYAVSASTMRHALAALSDAGLTKTLNGKGTVVLGSFMDNRDYSAAPPVSPAEAQLQAAILQCFILSADFIVKEVMPTLTDYEMTILAEKLTKIIDSGAYKEYNVIGVLLDYFIERMSSRAARSVYKQLEAQFCLMNRYYTYYAAEYESFFKTLTKSVKDAAKALGKKDADALVLSMRNQFKAVYELQKKAQRKNGTKLTVPLPKY